MLEFPHYDWKSVLQMKTMAQWVPLRWMHANAIALIPCLVQTEGKENRHRKSLVLEGSLNYLPLSTGAQDQFKTMS